MRAFKKGSIQKVTLSWTLKYEYIIHPFIFLKTTHRFSGTPGTILSADLSAALIQVLVPLLNFTRKFQKVTETLWA